MIPIASPPVTAPIVSVARRQIAARFSSHKDGEISPDDFTPQTPPPDENILGSPQDNPSDNWDPAFDNLPPAVEKTIGFVKDQLSHHHPDWLSRAILIPLVLILGLGKGCELLRKEERREHLIQKQPAPTGFEQNGLDPQRLKQNQQAFDALQSDPQRVTTQFSEEIKTIVNRSKPAVVGISYLPPAPPAYQRWLLGTGFFIREDGYILTNHHVVEGQNRVNVRLLDDTRLIGHVVAVDRANDLALIKVEGDKPFPTLRLASQERDLTGQLVIALGNPSNHGWTATMGIVSGHNRRLYLEEPDRTQGSLTQTDATIYYGNSGGPLINMQGDVVAINTARQMYPGAGFSVPAGIARRFADKFFDSKTTIAQTTVK